MPEPLTFGNGEYELRDDPENEDGRFILERLDMGDGGDECLGMWSDVSQLLMDIDYG